MIRASQVVSRGAVRKAILQQSVSADGGPFNAFAVVRMTMRSATSFQCHFQVPIFGRLYISDRLCNQTLSSLSSRRVGHGIATSVLVHMLWNHFGFFICLENSARFQSVSFEILPTRLIAHHFRAL
jgi:hypothetical protein